MNADDLGGNAWMEKRYCGLSSASPWRVLVFQLGTCWMFSASRLMWAANARNELLPLPGGWPSEQARQLESLETMTCLVREDAPDLEMERLWQEGDAEGFMRHLRSRLERD